MELLSNGLKRYSPEELKEMLSSGEPLIFNSTDFFRMDLSNMDLSGASCRDTVFSGADLRNVFLITVQHIAVRTLCSMIC